MNIQRKLTSITTAAALVASALVPLSTAASAEGWRDGNRQGGYGQSYNAYNNNQQAPRGYDRGDRGHDYRGYDRGRYDRYAYGRHRHHDNGKYIALGVGALMLGIIASEASHR
jgi:hypothetical protein